MQLILYNVLNGVWQLHLRQSILVMLKITSNKLEVRIG